MILTPKVTTSKLSSKRLLSLKLISERKVSTMSWNNQMSAKKGKDLVFRPEIALQVI